MMAFNQYGYNRLETDDEFRERVMVHWTTVRQGKCTDSFGMELKESKGEELDRLAWVIKLQRKLVYVS